MSPRPAATRRYLPSSPFNVDPASLAPPVVYAVDDRVCHDRHGLGRVVSTDETSVVVDFGEGKVVRVTASSDRLTQL